MAKRGVVIGISVVSVLIVAAGVISAVFLIHNNNKHSSSESPSLSSALSPSSSPSSSSPPSPSSSSSPSPSSSTPSKPNVTLNFNQACKATRHPKACQDAFSGSLNATDNGPITMLKVATGITADKLDNVITMVGQITDSAKDNKNLSTAAKTCSELLGGAAYRLKSVGDALPLGEIKDARAWLSATLAYESGCMSGLNKTGAGVPLVDKTVALLNNLVNTTSDALSMMLSYDVFGNGTGSWAPPKTERDGFWEKVTKSELGVSGGLPTGLKESVTVCSNGCDYQTIQKAVDAGPDDDVSGTKYVIRIKTGVYKETVRVPLKKHNVVFVGDGMGKTVITGSASVDQPGVTTYDSATVGVLGDGFMAKDLTIQNTAGLDAHQAVAFRSDSDRSIIENCEFIGNQDTLCANTLRQLYKGCRIQGNVDFIFGFSAAVFQDCTILVSPRKSLPDNNVISAHGRFDPAQTTGFVFLNCTVDGTDEYMALYKKSPEKCVNYLGRPWKGYSRTVFINCNLGSIIVPAGWSRWDGDFGLSTLYYAEFGNSGPGSDLSKREKWSSQIPADHIHAYSVQNFIQGDKWIPTASS